MKKIIIIGGVAGGASVAARVRRLDESAEITILERGPYISFANCGLPYHIGGEIKVREQLILQTPERFKARFNVEVKVLTEAMSIDRQQQTIQTKNLLTDEMNVLAYDILVLSPGAQPIVPAIPGFELPSVFSLRNIPDMDRIMSRLQQREIHHATVIGGGFIGLEMIEALKQQGIATSLVEQAPQVMTSIDEDMIGLVHQQIKQKGVDLKLNTAVTSIEQIDVTAQVPRLLVTLNNQQTLKTDLVILAIGVRPDIQLAQDAALEIGEFGGIVTNSQMQTSDPAIYALGDAVEVIDFVTQQPTLIPLAGPANRQGRIVANNICGIADAYQGSQGSAICKVFDLAVASTGKNERQLKRLNRRYHKVIVHTASHASYYPNSEMISFKLLYDGENGQILGAQAIGKQGVDKRIDVMAVALRAELNVEQLQHLELSYAPPYNNAKDVVNQAGFVADNLMKQLMHPIYAEEISQLTEHQLLLDVRNPEELQKLGQIKGAINIPLDQLRTRLQELPKEKEIIIYCQVGLRGHVAYRQLVQSGFRARNLIGGYRTYQLMFQEMLGGV